NTNTAATQFTIVYDNVPPSDTSVSIAGGAVQTNSNTVTLTLGATDVTEMYLSNTAGCSSGGAWEEFETTKGWALGQSNETATVYIKYRDALGNESSCISDDIIHDSIAPVAVISGTPASPTSNAAYDIDVQSGSGLETYQYALINGDAECSAASYGGTWIDETTNISGNLGASGAWKLCVIGKDAAGNGQSAATASSVAWTYDNVQPTITMASTSSNPNNDMSMPVIVTFSETVTGFAVGDLTVTGGSVANFTGSNSAYNFDLIPTGAGTLTVDIDAGVAVDASGNNNSAASQFNIVYDNVAPSATSITIAGGADEINNTAVTLTLAATDVNEMYLTNTAGCATGGVWEDFDAAKPWTLGQSNATATVYVKFRDGLGNESSCISDSVIHDSQSPVAVIGGAPATPNSSPAYDIDVQNDSGLVTYQYALIASTVECSAASYNGSWISSDTNVSGNLDTSGSWRMCIIGKDTAGNSQAPADATDHVWEYDNVQPGVALSTTSPNPTNDGVIAVTVTFTENVSGFEVGDLTVSGGSAGDFAGSNSVYNFNLTPTAAGALTVDIAGGIASDVVGNTNTAATQFSIIYDNEAPTGTSISIASGNSHTNNTSLTLTLAANDVAEMYVTNTAGCESGGSWEDFATTRAWTLAQSNTTASVYAKFRDTLGNESSCTSDSIVHDGVAPVAVLGNTPTTLSSSTAYDIDVQTDDGVETYQYAIIASHALCSGAVYNNSWLSHGDNISGNLSGSGTWKVCVIGKDLAGNIQPSGSATEHVWQYDNLQPEVAMTTTSSNPTNDAVINVTITFNEDVTGFVAADLNVSGGSAANFTGSAANYSFDLTPAAAGTLTVDIAAGVAADAAGNSNSVANQFSVVYDNEPPTGTAVTIGGGAVQTNNTSVTLTLAATDVSEMYLTNTAGCAAGGTWETFDTSKPWTLGQSNETATVYAKFRDALGNESSCVNDSIVHDSQAPVAVIGNTPSTPISTAGYDVDVQIDDGLVSYQFALIASTSQCSAASYNGSWVGHDTNITGNLDNSGGWTVCVIGKDAAGNGQNPAEATSYSWDYDNQQPTVAITSTSPNPTNDGVIAMTVTFNENVTGFVLGDITVSGGSAGDFAGSNNTYTFNFTPAAAGVLSVDIAGGIASDAVGNTNTAATQFSIVYDNEPPTETSLSVASANTHTSTTNVPLTLAASGADQMYVTNTADCASGGLWEDYATTRSWTIAQSNTTATVYTKFRDALGNESSCISDSIIHDGVAPVAVLGTTPASLTSSAAYDIDVQTDDGVETYQYAMIASHALCSGAVYNNSWISHGDNISGNLSGSGTWKVCVIGKDYAGNIQPSGSATEHVWQYDNLQPTVAITAGSSNPTNDTVINVTVTFDENVTGFLADDLNISGGTAANFTGSASNYSFDLTPAAAGTITVDIAAGVAIDSAGNGNSIANQFNIVYDNVPPTSTSISIAGGAVQTNNTAVTLTLGATDVSEMYLTNTAGCVAGGNWETFDTAKPWTLGQSNATATVYVKYRDALGNESGCVNDSILHDSIAPVAVIGSTPSTPTSSGAYDIDILTDDGLESYQYALIANSTACSAASYNGSWIDHTTNISGTLGAAGNWKVCVIGRDSATNGQNPADATSYSWYFDNLQPTIAISSNSSNPTNDSVITVAVNFNESVTGFDASDLNVAGGNVSNFTGSGSDYSFSFTPIAAGTLTVDVSPGLATDAAGNSNSVANQFSIVYDNVAPTGTSVTIAGGSAQTNNTAVTLTLTATDVTEMYLTNTAGCATGGSWEAYDTSKPWTLGQINDTATVYAKYRDALGNESSCVNDSIDHDSLAPVAVISSTPSTPNSSPAYNVDVQTDDGLVSYQYAIVTSISQCSAASYNGSWINSDTNISGNLNTAGSWRLCVIGKDAAGNGQNPDEATSFVWEYDNVQPSVAMTTSSTNPTNDGVIAVTVTFSESVTGFVISDLSVSGAIAGDFTGSNSVYNFNLTPGAAGVIEVDIPGGIASDAVGNTNTAATQFSIVYDNEPPTSTSLSIASGNTHTNSTSLTLTLAANGATQMYLTNTDGCASGGSWEDYATTRAWTIAQSNTTANVYAKFRDALGNESSCINDSIVHDGIAPVAALGSTPSSLTSTAAYDIDVQTDDGVETYQYAVIASHALCSGAVYNNSWLDHGQNISGNLSGSGTWKLCVIGKDYAGNIQASGSATEHVWQYDNLQPTVTISTDSSNPTNDTTIGVSVTFDENVTGFVVGDLTISGGSAANFTGSASNYSFDLTPDSAGTVTIDIASGVATDAAGNSNSVANQYSLVYDNVPPSGTSVTIAGGAVQTNNTAVTLTLAATDVSELYLTNTAGCVAGGTWETFDPSKPWTLGQSNATATVYAKFRDALGNESSCVNDSIIHDSAAPVAVISSTPSTPTSSPAYDIDVQTDDGLVSYQYAIIASPATCSAASYNGSWVNHDTNVSGNLNASGSWNVCIIGKDAAGNGQNPSNATSFAWVYDNEQPTVAITSNSSDPTNESVIAVTVTFSENVTGFVVGDLSVSGGTADNFAGTNNVYNFDLTPSAAGSITVDIAGGIASDAVGNTNTAATQFSIDYDNEPPTGGSLSIASGNTHTNNTSLTLTLAATGAEEMYVTNTASCSSGGSWEAFATTRSWTLAQSNTTANVYAKFRDALGNETSCISDSIVHDGIAPVTVLGSTPDSLLSSAAYDIDVLTDDGVENYQYAVIASHALCSGAVYNNSWLSHGSNITGNLSGSGTWKVCVIGKDGAGNIQASGSATEHVWQYDNVQPTVAMTTTSNNPTNDSVISVSVAFDENVTDFVVSDLNVSGGTAANFTGSASDYSFDLTPSAAGTVTVDIAAGVATDAAGNSNSVANQLSIVYDNVGPTGVSVSIAGGAVQTNNTAVSLTLAATDAAEMYLTNTSGCAAGGTWETFDTSKPWTLGQSNATATVYVKFRDALGNESNCVDDSIVHDSTAPVAVISSTPSTPTSNASYNIDVGTDDGLVSYQYAIIAGAAECSAASYNGTWINNDTNVSGNLSSSGSWKICVIGKDAAGNGQNSGDATSFIWTYDNAQPTVAITSSSSNPTNDGLIGVTVTFSEDVTGFVVGDLTVGGGSADNFAGSNSVYNFDLTPGAAGTITVDIAGGVVSDAVGNTNTSATQFTLVYDNVPPSDAALSIASGNAHTNNTSVTLTLAATGAEEMYVSNTADCASGGSWEEFATTRSWTMAQSNTTAIVYAKFRDALGNETSCISDSIVHDGQAPVTVLGSPPASLVSSANYDIDVQTDDGVETYQYALIASHALCSGAVYNNSWLSHGTNISGNLSGSGTWKVCVIGKDGAGNIQASGSATEHVWQYDNVQPTVTISTTSSDPNNDSSMAFAVTFNENVTDFLVGDLNISGGSAANFAGSGSNYSFDLTPAAAGTITVDVAAGSAIDAAGNGNSVADQFSLVYDNVAPTSISVSIAGGATQTNNTAVTLTLSATDASGMYLTNTAGCLAGGSWEAYDTAKSWTLGQTNDTATVYAKFRDALGNESSCVDDTIVHDSTAPVAVIGTTPDVLTSNAAYDIDIQNDNGLETYQYAIISNSSECAAASYNGTWTSHDTNLSGNLTGPGSWIACVIGKDAAGNSQSPADATSFSWDYDNVQPTVAITTSSANPNNDSSMPFTVTFSESVTGFVAGEVNISGGSISNFTGSASNYSFDLIPSTSGSITVDIAEGIASDAAGNNNTLASQFSITYDDVPPTSTSITIAGGAVQTNTTSVSLTLAATDASEMYVSNTAGCGAGGSWETFDTTKSWTLGQTNDSAVVYVKYRDTLGNESSCVSDSITHDSTAAVAVISSTPSSLTSESSYDIDVQTDNGLVSYQYALTLSTAQCSAASYNGSWVSHDTNISGTLSTPGSWMICVIGKDAAGNSQNSADATSFSWEYDNIQPTVTIASTSSDPTNASVIPMTVTFSENISGFVVGDINVAGGSAGDLAGSNNSYTFN
ncbi:MAG: hypothetical protein CMP10_00465, partial [Zetaproteobacteria bacterium]|nr:hypothetical protein [Pseudobdellovibrionaceae bacterium]